jgi:hypothetical protein
LTLTRHGSRVRHAKEDAGADLQSSGTARGQGSIQTGQNIDCSLQMRFFAEPATRLKPLTNP